MSLLLHAADNVHGLSSMEQHLWQYDVMYFGFQRCHVPQPEVEWLPPSQERSPFSSLNRDPVQTSSKRLSGPLSSSPFTNVTVSDSRCRKITWLFFHLFSDIKLLGFTGSSSGSSRFFTMSESNKSSETFGKTRLWWSRPSMAHSQEEEITRLIGRYIRLSLSLPVPVGASSARLTVIT